MHRAVEILKDYRRLAERHKVDKIVGVATSAIREARNGEDLLDRIGREAGIYVRAIPGEEEARFTYLAAQHGVHLRDKRALVVDLGGGSLELACGTGPDPSFTASEKLGILRMSERFAASDPLTREEEEEIALCVEEAMRPHAEKLKDLGFDCAVGTSGTILALGALAHADETGRKPEVVHHLTVSAASIAKLRRDLTAMPVGSRLKIKGLDPLRADVIHVGAVILDTICAAFGIQEILLSEWALREGVLMDYIRRHPKKLIHADDYPDVRRRSVMELAERCQFDEAHAFHAALLATSLFDQTKELHGLGDAERDLLEYSTLLHDIGHHISHARHHRHSYYLIRNGDLRGFSPLEVDVMASIARYHRRGAPRKKDSEFGALPRAARRAVRILAGLMRIGDALDRGHKQAVRALSVSQRGSSLRIQVAGAGDMELELWGARRRVDLLEKVLGLEIVLRAAPRLRAVKPKRPAVRRTS